ncbi:hypothetical protein VB779_08710 [Haloarculaceae archaeon H-GB11]|nr:hypothetical protein [Haloarculaceae archaeon H-GB11]
MQDIASTNPFDDGTASATIAIPAQAQRVQWYDSVGGSLENATAQSTAEGEHDLVERYDATDPSFDSPMLIYSVAYRHEWPVDARVWDDYNREKVYRESGTSAQVGSATVGSATVGGDDRVVDSQWQRVFVTDHDYVGRRVIETDRLRLVPDVDGEKLRAYRWDDSEGQYGIVQLGSSPWRLVDVNLRRIGVERIVGQLVFEDTSSPGTTEAIDMTVQRGRDNALFTTPPNVGSTSSGLVTRLSPIAVTETRAATEVATLEAREDVDR